MTRSTQAIWPVLILLCLVVAALVSYCEDRRDVEQSVPPTPTIAVIVLPTPIPAPTLEPTLTPSPIPERIVVTMLPTATSTPMPSPTVEPTQTQTRVPATMVQRG